MPIYNQAETLLDNYTSLSDTVYGADGITSWVENGVSYAATYSNGKLATVVGGGVTKTFTWSSDNLISVVVS